MHIREVGKYRKAVAGGRPQFPLEVAAGSLWLGRARGETLSTGLPGMQRGSRKGFSSQPQYDRWLLGGLSRREHPVAIRLGGRSGYRIPGREARVIEVGSYGEVHLWRSAFQQSSGQVFFQEGGHLVVDSLRFARRENQGVAGHSSDGVEPCAAQCGLGG